MQQELDEHIIPEIPSLEPGVTLLESADPGPLHALVIDHILLERESAWWIDTGGYAQVEPLHEIAPSKRALNRINVARAFTAYQHHTLCERLLGDTSHNADGVDQDDVGLIVVPAVDGLYRDEDITDHDPEPLLVHSLARIARASREHDCPVLVTKTRDDSFAEPVDRLVDQRIECVSTSQGPRFQGDTFETLVYPLGDGWMQTTLAFWNHILSKREPFYPTAFNSETIKEVA